MSSSSSEILTAEPLSGGEFKAQPQPAPTSTSTNNDEVGLQPRTHALFTMLDYTLTPVALTVLISLLLVSVACLALMALAVKRTLWDKPKSNKCVDAATNDAKRRRHRHRGSSEAGAVIIYDVSDGSRGSGIGTDRARYNGVSSSSGAIGGSMSCLVGLLVAASFIGIAIGMAFAIDRTVVALC